MANGRCPAGQPPGQAPEGKAYRGQALHGGKSTGPRTPDGGASVARAHTTHGDNAQAGPGAKLRVLIRHGRGLARRMLLAAAAYRHLRWLPRALAARLLAYEATELHAPMHYAQFQDAPVPLGSSAPPG